LGSSHVLFCAQVLVDLIPIEEIQDLSGSAVVRHQTPCSCGSLFTSGYVFRARDPERAGDVLLCRAGDAGWDGSGRSFGVYLSHPNDCFTDEDGCSSVNIWRLMGMIRLKWVWEMRMVVWKVSRVSPKTRRKRS
jgi:hypothetical protein